MTETPERSTQDIVEVLIAQHHQVDELFSRVLGDVSTAVDLGEGFEDPCAADARRAWRQARIDARVVTKYSDQPR